MCLAFVLCICFSVVSEALERFCLRCELLTGCNFLSHAHLSLSLSAGHFRLLLLNFCRIYGAALVTHINQKVASIRTFRHQIARLKVIQVRIPTILRISD
jgi:hypothetical protein